MCEFKNGDVVEYEIEGKKWLKGRYIGPVPQDALVHVITTASNVITSRLIAQLRKPKVKHVGWIGVVRSARDGNWNSSHLIYQSEATAKANWTLVARVEWEE